MLQQILTREVAAHDWNLVSWRAAGLTVCGKKAKESIDTN
jgi:hypothetical protein